MFRLGKGNSDKAPRSFFNNGWGEEKILEELQNYPLHEAKAKKIKVTLKDPKKNSSFFLIEGEFESPFPKKFLPEVVRKVHFQIHSPTADFQAHPICVLFAMTGDQGFSYRYNSYSRYLLKKGIATLLVENPFYGARRPSYQKAYHFVSVADMLAMAMSAVEEGVELMEWLKDQGCTRTGVGGVSQAAMIAGAVGALTPHPVAVACSLVAHSPEVILCDGLLRKFVNWQAIDMGNKAETQYRLIQTFRPTDLTKLPRPQYPQATLLQGAFNDLVAPRYSVKMIHRLWPGSELRWLPGTHFSSLVLHKSSFSRLVADALAKLPLNEK